MCLAILAGETASGGEVTRIGFGSCMGQHNHQDFWKPILMSQPDVFVFLGDNVYDKGDDMEYLRDGYRMVANHPGYQKLQETSLVLATWDDHDFGRNDAGAEFPLKDEAEDIFETFWSPDSPHPASGHPGIYHVVTIGELGKRIQIILLDTRYFRSALKSQGNRGGGTWVRYLPNVDPGATLLGERQWEWLAEVLKEPADLRIIASSIQVIAEDHAWEKWANFPLDRARLIQMLKDTETRGAIIISGDRHNGEISMMPPEATGLDYPLYDITSSSLNRRSSWAPGREFNRWRVVGHTVPQNHFGILQVYWEEEPALVSMSLIGLDGVPYVATTLRFDELGLE